LHVQAIYPALIHKPVAISAEQIVDLFYVAVLPLQLVLFDVEQMSLNNDYLE
jgi:hypothetical protein